MSSFCEEVKKTYKDEQSERNIYPGNLTHFSIEDTKRGCGDYFASGRSSGKCFGDCCIFCIPVTIAIDIVTAIPFGIWCMGDIAFRSSCRNVETSANGTKDVIISQPQAGVPT